MHGDEVHLFKLGFIHSRNFKKLIVAKKERVTQLKKIEKRARAANFLKGYSFVVPSGASACNLGWFLENSCQTPKHDGISIYSHGMLFTAH